jgi:hypothetical protein
MPLLGCQAVNDSKMEMVRRVLEGESIFVEREVIEIIFRTMIGTLLLSYFMNDTDQ